MQEKQYEPMPLPVFLTIPDPARYDLRAQIINFHTFDSIDRYQIYKAVGIAEGKGYISDPVYIAAWGIRGCHEPLLSSGEADQCELVREIFRQIYPNFGQTGLETCDTMNSAFTTLKYLFHLIDMRYQGREIRSNIQMLGLYLNGCFRKTISFYPEAVVFLSACYTIGNILPIPAGCNGPRGMGATEDYWDLALLEIFRWYASGDLSHLVRVTNSQMAPVYAQWLAGFQNWDTFVQKNFLQPFVEKLDENRFGLPHPLWPEHFSDLSHAAPNSLQDVLDFFRNAAAWIQERGENIITYLRQVTGPDQANLQHQCNKDAQCDFLQLYAPDNEDGL